MKFFIPHTKKATCEAVYQGMAESLKSQFRMPIDERRIFSLNYTNSKKKWHAEVGQLEEQEGRYEIVAIFEAKFYIVFTQAKNNDPGLTILVDKNEVTAVEEFAQ
jgi:hypothetical protein